MARKFGYRQILKQIRADPAASAWSRTAILNAYDEQTITWAQRLELFSELYAASPTTEEYAKLGKEELLALYEKREEDVFGTQMESIQAPEGESYFYFTAAHFIELGILTGELVAGLRSGKNLLHLGAGNCLFDTALRGCFGVPKDRLSVADIKLHFDARELGFKAYEFDMTAAWPWLPEKYDNIYILESLGVATMGIHGEVRTHRFYEDIEAVEKAVLAGKPVEPWLEEHVLLLIDMDVPVAKRKLAVIREALLRLKHGGTVLANTGLSIEQQFVYIVLKLRKEFPGLRFEYNADWQKFLL